MASISFTKFFSLIFVIIAVVTLSMFATRMDSFRKDLSEAADTISCSEEDNRTVTSEEDCYYKYKGSPVLKKFDNVPTNKVCCQLK
ncbi:MAG: hypothetical protein KAK00_09120 [Nanoarchaeota archaeon]|nr:hypothetical protein [Nanoarchaeota archaeon]